ncbi:MAG TPA: ABC transporter substrate-binding protein [Acetobacteraceae bacterium]|nr:ABC transporter substrate-binding protein [Acetobacteraceae bacterium]
MKTMPERLIAVLSGGLAVLLVAAALALPGQAVLAKDLQPVSIADTSPGLQLILPQIALKEGFFAKHGLAVTLTMVTGDAGSIPALVSGSVNFSIMTSTPALVAESKGGDLQIISSLSTYPEQIVMGKALAARLGITAATPLAEKVKALRGQTVAVYDVGGGLQYQLEALVSSYGINPREVPVVGISPYTSQVVALARGAIGAIAPAVPFGQVAVEQGYGVMIADIWGGEVPSLRSTPFEVMSVERKWGKAHKATVEAVRAALGDAMTFLHAHPAKVVELAHELQPKISVAVQTAAIGTGAGYPTTTALTPEQFKAMQSFAGFSGAKTATVTYAQAVWAP